MFVMAILAALMGVASLAPYAAAQEEKQTTIKEKTELVIEGTLRGLTRGVLVAQQVKTAQQNWKRINEKDPPAIHETPNFLLLGSVPGKTLQEIGETLEKQLEAARKALKLEGEDPWPGKLAVYLLPERGRYNSFVRGVEKRRVEEDELGCLEVLKTEAPHVAATAGMNPQDPSVDGQASEQMAAARRCRKKLGTPTRVPEWVLAAFGRCPPLCRAAHHAQCSSAEHRRVQQLLNQKIRMAKDVIGAGLAAEEATVLRANLIEYLAYSGRTAKFVPFLLGFRPTENVAEPTTDMALAAATLTSERLTEVWHKWVKTLK